MRNFAPAPTCMLEREKCSYKRYGYLTRFQSRITAPGTPVAASSPPHRSPVVRCQHRWSKRVLATARHVLTGFSSSDVHRSTTCFEMIVPRPWDLRHDQSADDRARRLRPSLGGSIRRLDAQAATTSPDR